MLVTLAGIVTLVRPQDPNAKLPMLLRRVFQSMT
jgi:hypothetical protein